MKKVYLKAMSLCAFLALGMNAMAADIYVAKGGNDANDGSSASSALATLNAAVAKAQSGDVIKVSGSVTVSETVKLDGFGDLTIEGVSSADNDKLDGANKVQILNVLNTNLTLRNLTLRRGLVQADKEARGGAMWCRGKVVTVANCVFERNNTSYNPEDNGGAIFVTDGTLNIYDSEFTQNAAYRGGAIEAQVSTLFITNSTFSKNNTFSTDDTRVGQANGGALAIGKSTATIKYSQLLNNSSGGRGGAVKVWTDNTEGKSVTFQGCAIVGTEGGGPGGVFSIDLNNEGSFKFNVFSTTITQNSNTAAGGVLCIESANSNANEEINFVNCTITNNGTSQNTGNSGGFMCHGGSKLKAKLNIVNTILEGNYSSQGWADARFARNADPDYVYIYNSIIGHAFQDANDGDLTNVWDSEINTTMQPRSNPLTAGLPLDEEGLPILNEDGYCIPPTAGSLATTMGSIERAKQFGCTTDQFGQTWTKPFIGAVQLVDGDNIPETPSGIETVKVKQTADNAYYTLQGIRVEKPVKGLYIYKGKKVVLK